MESQKSNLVEIKRLRPKVNRTRYKAIVHRSLNSVSNVSQTSLLAHELNSKSEPISRKRKGKRTA